MTSRTTVITVTYNSATVVGTMIESVPPDTPLIVVDNDSTDATVAVLECFDLIKTIQVPTNVGFGRACNLGAAQANTEFLLFLNPDAQVAPLALEHLEAEADQKPNLGAANPRIENSKGAARLKVTSVVPIPKLRRPDITKAALMPVLSGAALFVRRAAFEQVGGFDPKIFLYHEDHDLCWRLREKGHQLWHLPQATVRHIAGTGSARTPATARWKGYQMARSRYYVLEKSRPGTGLRRSLWPACLSLLSPINFLSARRRQKYLGQFYGALSATRDGGEFNLK